MHPTCLREWLAIIVLVLMMCVQSGCKPTSTVQEKKTASAGPTQGKTATTDPGDPKITPKNAANNNKSDDKNADAQKLASKKQQPGTARRGPRRGGARKAPAPTAEELAVLELVKRIGGSAKRPPGDGGPPGGLAFITLPGDKGKNDDLKIVAALPSIFLLRVESPGFSDQGMATIAAIQDIGTLHLVGSSFTDKGIALLAGHKKLRILILDRVTLGAAGLTALSKNDALEFVDLVSIPITPEIMAGLKQLRLTREIRLLNTGISAQDQATLKEQLPDCDIVVSEGDKP